MAHANERPELIASVVLQTKIGVAVRHVEKLDHLLPLLDKEAQPLGKGVLLIVVLHAPREALHAVFVTEVPGGNRNFFVNVGTGSESFHFQAPFWMIKRLLTRYSS